MSEYQYVHFMALDRPLNDKQLAYMETQSSRAEISPWAFTNEYHFGEFRGNVNEMLRRGYDVYLEFASYGVRRLMIRLPGGLPWSRKTFRAYLPDAGVTWHPDRTGRGGILQIQPDSEGEEFDSDINDLDEILPAIAPMRDLLIAGDLRPLYVLWLAMAKLHGLDETMELDGALEPPLPAGMASLPGCLTALADFYELDGDLLDAASKGSPPLPKRADTDSRTAAWVARLSKDELRDLVRRLLSEDATDARTQTLAHIRDDEAAVTWPTVAPTRTFAELTVLADEIQARRTRRTAARNAKARQVQLKKLAADPAAVIAEVERLITGASTNHYTKAAKQLVDLGEALGAPGGQARVQAEAERLRAEHPRALQLIRVLREHGLLVKRKRSRG